MSSPKPSSRRPIEIAEEVFGASADEILTAAGYPMRWRTDIDEAVGFPLEREFAENAAKHDWWSPDLCRQLTEQLSLYYTSFRAPVYDEHTVVPRLYPRSSVLLKSMSSAVPIQWWVDEEAVATTLALAHGVELVDPLPDAARSSLNSPFDLLDALRRWQTLRPLADAGVVHFVTPSPQDHPEQLLSTLTQSDAFLSGFDRSCRGWGLHAGPENLWPVSTYFALNDLSYLLDVAARTAASAWLPSERHLGVLAGLAHIGLAMPAGLRGAARTGRLLDLQVSTPALTSRAIVDLRRNSDVFELWRTTLSGVLRDLDALPIAPDQCLAPQIFREEMAAVAVGLSRRLTTEFRSIVPSRAKQVAFGVLAGGIEGIATTGSLEAGALGAAVGGVAREAGEVAASVRGRRQQRQAERAARTHALLLSREHSILDR